MEEKKITETEELKEGSANQVDVQTEDASEGDVKKKSPMMKKWMPIIITAAVLVVAAVTAFILYKAFPPREDIPVYDNAPGEEVVVSDLSAKFVESIEFEDADGKSFEVVYTTDEQGNQVGTVTGAGEEFKYDSQALWELAGIAKLFAVEEIKDADGRDDEFGFDDPKREIQINFKGNKKLELIVGNDVPKNDWYEGIYVKRVDTGSVYVLGGDTAKRIMISISDCRDISIKKYYSEYEIDEISIQRPGKDKITISRKQDVELNADSSPKNEGDALYELTSPNKKDANNSAVEERLLAPFIAIRANTLVEDNPEDLAKYGLANPTVIVTKDKEGETHTIKVGKVAKEGGNYMMYDDVPSVITSAEPITFLELKHTDLLENLVWLYNSRDISSISYTGLDGISHVVQVAGNKASYGNKAFTTDEFNNLFLATFGMTIQGGVTSDMAIGNVIYTIEVNTTDGGTYTLEIAPISDRRYAIRKNAERFDYFINKNDFTALENVIVAIMEGKTIPAYKK